MLLNETFPWLDGGNYHSQGAVHRWELKSIFITNDLSNVHYLYTHPFHFFFARFLRTLWLEKIGNIKIRNVPLACAGQPSYKFSWVSL